MDKKQCILLILATAVISGFSIFINKFSVSKIEPYTFTFIKNIVVAMLLIAIIFFTKEFYSLKQLTKKQWFQLILIGFVGGSIPFLLFFKGLSLASAASASFVYRTLFIYASIFAFFILKEKINLKVLAAAILLLVGNFFLLKLKAFSFGMGEILVLIAAIIWGLEIAISKLVLKDLSGNIVAFGRMFFGSIFILLFLAFAKKLNVISSLSSVDYLWIVITAVLLLLYVATFYNGLKYVKVSVAASILLLGSPITTLLSLTTTAITALEIFGILLIIAGIGIMILFVELKTTASQQHIHNE